MISMAEENSGSLMPRSNPSLIFGDVAKLHYSAATQF